MFKKIDKAINKAMTKGKFKAGEKMEEAGEKLQKAGLKAQKKGLEMQVEALEEDMNEEEGAYTL